MQIKKPILPSDTVYKDFADLTIDTGTLQLYEWTIVILLQIFHTCHSLKRLLMPNLQNFCEKKSEIENPSLNAPDLLKVPF